jgi:hypothetical protein
MFLGYPHPLVTTHEYGSEDPDPHPVLYQNVTDPQHCFLLSRFALLDLLTVPVALMFHRYIMKIMLVLLTVLGHACV